MRLVAAPGWSRRARRRRSALGVAVIVAAGVAGSLLLGDVRLGPVAVGRALLGDGDVLAGFVVRTLRAPRALTALGVGVAFGMSGALFQALVRNPLGSPDVMGFEAGAACGAVIAIVGGAATGAAIAGGAVLGGAATAIVVAAAAWRGGLRVDRLVLVGIGVGAALIAVVDHLLVRARSDDAARAAVWLTGSLNGRTWSHAGTIWSALVLLLPAALAAGRAVDRLALGDDLAVAHGVRLGATRVVTIVVGVLLASIAVASAGPVVFVAFVAGPVARRLADDPGAAVGGAGLVGAAVVVWGDVLAVNAVPGRELPVGVVTAAIGAPYLLWLLARSEGGVL